MVTAQRPDDLEPLEQFVARERLYPEPWYESREQVVTGGLKRRRGIDHIHEFTTKEETETGRALALWWVRLLDLWIASDALPENQRRVMALMHRTEHPCEASGRHVGGGARTMYCPWCEESIPGTTEKRRNLVPVNRVGILGDHNRFYGLDDAAEEMGITTRWAGHLHKLALEAIKTYIFPPGSEPSHDDA